MKNTFYTKLIIIFIYIGLTNNISAVFKMKTSISNNQVNKTGIDRTVNKRNIHRKQHETSKLNKHRKRFDKLKHHKKTPFTSPIIYPYNISTYSDLYDPAISLGAYIGEFASPSDCYDKCTFKCFEECTEKGGWALTECRPNCNKRCAEACNYLALGL